MSVKFLQLSTPCWKNGVFSAKLNEIGRGKSCHLQRIIDEGGGGSGELREGGGKGGRELANWGVWGWRILGEAGELG